MADNTSSNINTKLTKRNKSRRSGKTGKVVVVSKKRSKRRAQAPTHPGLRPMDELKSHVPLFPTSTRKKLMYYESGFTQTGTAGAVTQYVFSANGIYDPNITSTGHQPMGFDTMMLYYEQYTVVRSSISLRFAGNGIQPAVVSVCLAPDTTTLVLPDIIENGLVTTQVVDGRANGGNGTGIRIKRLGLSCDVVKYFGRKSQREILDDVNLFGTVAANPTEQVYFVINTWGFGAFTDNTSVAFDAVLEYDVVFWEPRKVASQLAVAEEKYPAKDFPPMSRSQMRAAPVGRKVT